MVSARDGSRFIASLLRAMFTVSGTPLALFRPDGALWQATPAARALLGLVEADLPLHSWHLVDGRGRALPASDNPVLACLRTGHSALPVAVRWQRPDGEVVDLLLQMAATPADEQGRRHVVARVIEPAALEHPASLPEPPSVEVARSRLIDLLSTPLECALAIIDPADRLESWNDAFAALIETDEEWLRRRPTTAEMVERAGLEWEEDSLRRGHEDYLAQSVTSAPMSAVIERRDGTRGLFCVAAIGGGRRLIVGHRLDGTEPAELERISRELTSLVGEHTHAVSAVELASQRASEAERAKARFVATVSHELRTPLNNVLGFLDLLVDGVYATPDEARLYAERAQRAAQELYRLIGDLLDLSRVEAGLVPHIAQELSLTLLAAQAAEQFQAACRKKSLALTVPEVTDEPRVLVDADRLRQVLNAVLDNAVKFTDCGAVTVTVGHDGPLAWVEVRDTGTGVAAEEIGAVFESFMQADAGSRRSRGGLGIGLALARGLLQAMGGRIRLLSDGLGQGTTVRIELPAISG